MLQIERAIQRVGKNLRRTWGIRIDGVDRSDRFANDWSATHDAEASFASATLTVLRPFQLSAGRHTVAIYSGWEGVTDLVFYGEIVTEQRTYYKRRQIITAGGYLTRTNVGLDRNVAFCYSSDGTEAGISADLLAQVGERELQNDVTYQVVPIQTDATIIVFTLEAYGITPGSAESPNINHSIEASARQVARFSPIFWDNGTPGWTIVRELDEKVSPNYRTFDGRTGAVYRRPTFGTVPSGVRYVFRQGVAILDLTLTKDYRVFNQVIVRGAMDELLQEQIKAVSPVGPPEASAYIAPIPGVRTDESIASAYIETLAEGQAIADIQLGIKKQPLQEFELLTFACSDMDVADALGVDDTELSTNAFVTAHTISARRSTLRMRGSTVAEPRPNQPPVPAFAVKYVKERMYVAGTLQDVVLIEVDASTSRDPDGVIASTSISIGGTTYPPGPTATHVHVGPPPVQVSVTVTDDGGLSATLTQSVTWTDDQLIVEPIVLAELTTFEGSADGEKTWQTYGIPVVMVAPIAITGFVLGGCADGTLYRSTDQLATAPTHVFTFPAAITAIWINEKLEHRALVGLQDGSVWLSIDGGQQWTGMSKFAAAINDLSESPFAASQATVSTGDSVYGTFDLKTWTPLLQRAGHTALRHAGGFEALYGGWDDSVVLRYRNDSDPSLGDRNNTDTSSEA